MIILLLVVAIRLQGTTPLAVIFITLFLVYLPVLTGYYLIHDDWTVFDWNPRLFFGHNIAPYLIYECGRPLGAVVLVLLTRFIKTIADANVARFALVVLLSLSAFLSYRLVRCLSPGREGERLEPLLLTLFIFTLPPFLSSVGYLSNGLDLAGMIFGLLAITWAFRAYRGTAGGIPRSFFLPGVLFFLLCLVTYQPMAFLFWAFLAFEVLSWDPGTMKERLGRPRALLGLLGNFILPLGLYGLYVILWKHFVAVTVAMDFPSESYCNRALWFFQRPMTNVLNLWRLFPSPGFAWGVAALLGAGVVVEAGTRLREKVPLPTIGALLAVKILALPCFLLGSEFPILMARGRYGQYRSLVGAYLLVALALYWALGRLSSWCGPRLGKTARRTVLGICCLVAFYQANYNLSNYMVFPSTLEVRYLKSRLRQVDLSQYQRIYILRPDYECGSFVAPQGRYDEFGRPETGAFQNVYSLVKAIFIDLGVKITHDSRTLQGMVLNDRWTISHGTREEYREYPEPTLVIDMRRLEYYY